MNWSNSYPGLRLCGRGGGEGRPRHDFKNRAGAVATERSPRSSHQRESYGKDWSDEPPTQGESERCGQLVVR